jgi:hypothetical protein
VRLITSVAAAALAAAIACAASWASSATALAVTTGPSVQSPATASPAACYAVAVQALRRHVVVHRMPLACAGLAPQQVNEAIARAIRTVVGPAHKAAGRRLANADSRYLGSLVRQASPPRGEAAAVTAPPPASSAPARLAALASWLAAAVAGAWLLSRRLSRGRRQVRRSGVPLSIAVAHAGLAGAGLCLWVAFLLTAAPALGWIDVALTWVIVGLGMATLLADGPQAASTAVATAGGPAAIVPLPASRPPVLTIALHGAFATVTIVLVQIAVISVG